MLPIYFIIGLINVLAKTNNYGINTDDPETLNIRVRRNVLNTETSSKMLNHLLKHPSEDLVRDKRQFSFFYPKKTAKPTTTTPKYSYNNVIQRQNYRNNYNGRLDYNFVTQNNGMMRSNGRLPSNNATRNYYFSNTSWNASNAVRQNNYRSDSTYIRNNLTGFYEYRYNIPVNNYSNSHNGFPGTRPYPFKATLMPKFNTSGTWKSNGTGYNGNGYNGNGYNSNGYNSNGYNVATPKYDSQPIYNYQDPSKSNFSGYVEHNFTRNINNTSGYNTTTIRPYAPGYQPIPTLKPSNSSTHWYNNFNNTPAPFQPGYATTPQYVSTTPGYGGKPNINGTVTTSTEIAIACVICNIGCAEGYHRIGLSCEPDDVPDY